MSRRATTRRRVGWLEPLESREMLAVISFQDGVAPVGGYGGTRDVEIREASSQTNFGSSSSINVDGDEPSGSGDDTAALISWDLAPHLPAGTPIQGASITLQVTNSTPHSYEIYESLRDWTENGATWINYASGQSWQTSGAQGSQDRGSQVLGTLSASTTGSHTLNLNAAGVAVVQNWVDNPTQNRGLIIADSSSTDGVDFASRETGTASSRPRLTVAYDDGTGGSPPQYEVKHNPRLQPGDAPLVPYPGSETDQVQVIWQTVPAGIGVSDSFTVEYRAVGDPTWIDAGAPSTIDTGVGGRVNHYVDILGLDFDSGYEYRVRHVRDAEVLATYQSQFETRVAPGDTQPLRFVAYGDSADPSDIQGFRDVQHRINLIDPDAAILLGDNVYNVGSHSEFDSRLDPDVNPEAASWTAGHIDYVGYGNHDISTDGGRPTEDNYAVPIPVDEVTSSTELPASEPDEHNYSFDYGMVHFATFDTNSLGNSNRLAGQLAWLQQDMAASNAPWKIVFGHHPIAGVPDKPESPDDNYYQQVVAALRAVGVDLFLVGHSHTFGWTYPLLGEENGEATFVQDEDKDYEKGAGLIQVVSGLGGREVRSGTFGGYPFVVEGFSNSTSPQGEYGVAQLDVTENQLTVSYIAADNGATIDQFTITDSGVELPEVSITANDSSATESETQSDPGEFTFSRTSTEGMLTVGYSIGGTAQNIVDYQSISGSVTFQDGEASVTVQLLPVEDAVVEQSETVVLTIQPGSGYTVGGSGSGVVTITDNDSALVNVVTNPNLDMAEPGSDGQFAVSLGGGISQTDTVVNYSVSGTATPGSDYVALSGSVTIPAMASSAVIDLVVIDDQLDEPDESITVTLTGIASGDPDIGVGSPSIATETIADDDEVLPVVDHRAQTETTVSGTVTEGNLTDTYGSNDLHEVITETESAGKPSNRYTYLEHYWTFSVTPGDSVTFFVEAFHNVNSDGDDFRFEYSTNNNNYNPLFTVTKTGPDNGLDSATIPGNPSGTVYVRVVDTNRAPGNRSIDSLHIDDMFIRTVNGGEVLPTVTVVASDPQAVEPSDTGRFTITRAGDLSEALTVFYSLAGSATEGADYLTSPAGGSVTIPADTSSATVDISPQDDDEQEETEEVVLTIDPDATYMIGTPADDTVFIMDDDMPSSTDDVTSSSDVSVHGFVFGSHTATHMLGGSAQTITEEPYAGNNRTRLEHQWSFPLTGSGAKTFFLSWSPMGEMFEFAYSGDGVNWTTMNLTQEDSTYDRFDLPSGLSGTVWIRVVDTDRSKNDPTADSVTIDHMFIRQ